MSSCTSVDHPSAVASLTAAAAAALALAACVDPPGKFQEFEDRVIDADTRRIDGSGAIFDISGEFLLAIRPHFAAPNDTLQFVATASLVEEGGVATVDFSFQPLSAEKCGGDLTAVGDPLEVADVAVSAAGEFEATFEHASVPREANGVSCSSDIEADVGLQGQIKSADLFCGGVVGQVFRPSGIPPLDGSTFAAIRIEPGTIGAELPDPLVECPPDAPPDAGPPDAGPPDAGPPDGGVPDASP